ncbi:periplasmic binding protein-like II [Xylaria bambusicola]|uniref:periplasmic binding protein-like II n=1 Tax=Xylaria bambusicola TaxID=326684 RepID=UPI002007B350|nr:periplasmic binding protein-like II [Xylaria bambusicola]KAI0506336.1 periplasmic binding protein-like II [Xylaria bambusicola]
MHSSPIFWCMVLLLATPSLAALKVASSLIVLEWTPEIIAKEDYYNGTVSIVNGGIPSLFSDPSVDIGANSETQLLRQYASHKNLRTILTTVEVYYRIVASKKKGIEKLEDLKGKRIGAFASTSSEYFVRTLLATVGLAPSDYTIVPGVACLKEPCGSGTFPAMLKRGAIDAIGMWEPSVQLGAEAIGADAIMFEQTIYREIYNLATTAEKLADAAKRKEIVAFVAALVKAEDVFRIDPEKVVARAAAAVKTNATLFREVWPVHRWTARNPLDLVDVLLEEDKYVARADGRAVMSRELLENLVDRTLLADALLLEEH